MSMEAALEYAKLGWHVLPLHSIVNGQCTCGGMCGQSAGKHPRTMHGLKDATSNPELIRNWWQQWPEANIGIRTGGASGFVAIDIDPRNGGDATWDSLISEHGRILDTVEAITGGGGRHILFTCPSNGTPLRGKLGQGIDVKAEGGYIVVEPSIHASGQSYSWELSSRPGEIPIAEMPPWLLDLATDRKPKADAIPDRPRCVDSEAIPQELQTRLRTKLNEDVKDRSIRDYLVCRELQHAGVSREAARVFVMNYSKFAERGEEYFDRTWQAAAKASSPMPVVLLPGGNVRITDAAKQLGKLVGDSGRYFIRDGVILKLEDHKQDRVLKPIRPAQFASTFERIAILHRMKNGKDGSEEVSATCNESTAKLLIESDAFIEEMPHIHIVSACPIMTELADGALTVIEEYDRDSGILASGEVMQDMTIEAARDTIDHLLSDFLFASDSDRSRAIASLITPALVFGGMLDGRAPIDITEADASQAGKGYRYRLTAAIYSATIHTIVQKKNGGVGGAEEDLSSALIAGRPFISFDNYRGRIDLPSLEALLTEDRWPARIPYSGCVMINPTRTVFMMTSNGVELTQDLANRASITRIRKQPTNYRFKTYGNGIDTLSHIKMNAGHYLGAIFRIIREWHCKGKPKSDAGGFHDFRGWASVLAYIVQDVLGAAPLLEGHTEVKRRTSNPNLNYARDICVTVCKTENVGVWMRTHDILDLLIADGGVPIPTVGADDDIEDGTTRERVLMAVGRKLKAAMSGEDHIEIDGTLIERREASDSECRPVPEYRFSSKTLTPSDAQRNPATQRTLHTSRGNNHPPENIKMYGTVAGLVGIDGIGGAINEDKLTPLDKAIIAYQRQEDEAITGPSGYPVPGACPP